MIVLYSSNPRPIANGDVSLEGGCNCEFPFGESGSLANFVDDRRFSRTRTTRKEKGDTGLCQLDRSSLPIIEFHFFGPGML